MNQDFFLALVEKFMRGAGLFAWALLGFFILAALLIGFWEQFVSYGIPPLAVCILVLIVKFLRRRPAEEESLASLPPLSRDDLRVAQSKLKNTPNR